MTKLICINCPNGCEVEIDEKTLEVSGNKCPRGKEFAINELTHPTRSITTTVRTTFKDCPVIPVRTNGEIPKEKIFEVMNEINKVVIDKKVKRGDIIIKNVLKLNIDVIATSSKLNNI